VGNELIASWKHKLTANIQSNIDNVFNKTFNISNVEDIYNMVNSINIKSNSMDGLDECEQV